MGLFCGILYVLFIVASYVYCDDEVAKMEMVSTTDNPLELDIYPDVENMIQKCQDLSTSTHYLLQGAVSPIENVEKLYEEITDMLDKLIETVKNSNNAYKFLKAKGLDRLVVPNIKIDYQDLKVRVLLLLKVLFEVAPSTTNAVIPIGVVDGLLNIFEADNLALKAHSLDVLYLWLPDNPRVQARVMKIKGLEPFYEQISKLDTNVIKLLLELFNKILNEHLKARSDVQKTQIGAANLKFYQQIGLLEHVSTPTVCNGLLNIFMNTWSYNTKDNNILMTVFDLLKNIKQFCIKVYRGKTKALKLFTALQEYVKSPENKESFDRNGVNVTDVELVIEDYIDKLKQTVKEEL